jgi:beta-carotene hydroxylase
MELKYYVMYIPKLTSRPASEAMQTVVILAVMVFAIVGLCNMGYGKTILWGWILPGRLATALLAYFFDYLPHRPHAVSKNHSPYVATNVTSLVGEHTAPLTWPLLHQNYHNIHHLAPYVPFYFYSTVWHSLKNQFLERGTKIKPILEAS